jgi:hypothetical protein
MWKVTCIGLKASSDGSSYKDTIRRCLQTVPYKGLCKRGDYFPWQVVRDWFQAAPVSQCGKDLTLFNA